MPQDRERVETLSTSYQILLTIKRSLLISKRKIRCELSLTCGTMYKPFIAYKSYIYPEHKVPLDNIELTHIIVNTTKIKQEQISIRLDLEDTNNYVDEQLEHQQQTTRNNINEAFWLPFTRMINRAQDEIFHLGRVEENVDAENRFSKFNKFFPKLLTICLLSQF
ncbi:unnamed protein product [Didymodactylos carnosus]|uniref:Uncharacterized protein n=1 Tax=Didymodactylos carnosus TaxID=1234261 RepID=A0A8S2MLY1_9BILA|nr:unnamed protein product [Didymodactylos carnosus]CAF3962554.1 unnamed protein product [Didymodactylos carnosus]